MDLFTPNEAVDLLEHRLAGLQGTSRLGTLVTLAWHLRQRDCARALTLADEAQALLALSLDAGTEPHRLAARLLLLRAEVKLMFADLPAAQQLGQAAMTAFADVQDPLGQGDVSWLQASLATDRGDGDQITACLNQALIHYRAGGDLLRTDAALARSLIYAAFRDPAVTAVSLQHQFPSGTLRVAGVTPWVETAQANVAGLTNDPGRSIRHDLAAYHGALDIGQIRAALVSVNNAVEAFALLGDLDAALEWMESALALARSTGWPASIGVCLMQMGDVMRLMTRHDEAKRYLQEALLVMAPVAGSRNYEQVLGNLGQLALDMGDFAAALAWFSQLEEHVQAHQEPDLLIKAWRGQASALLHLHRTDEASMKAHAALALAREHGNAEGQIQALRILAKVSTSDGTAALNYLNQALAVAATMDGYSAAPELLYQVAAANATSGDFQAAYDNALAANAARSKMHSEEAQKRVLAMQIRQQVERARSETQTQQKIADTLKETAATLETLGIIGREITASLDADAVFEALHRHVHQLLDATFFAVYLLDAGHKTLGTAFGIEAGVPLPVIAVTLDHPTSMFARAARERQEVMIDREHGVDDPNLIPGTLPCLSQLYFPLIAGERLLGAMSVQAPRSHAYGEREHAIFRTLCAYGAIALDNASAYGVAHAAQERADQALGALRQTQSQLLAQNRQLERLSVTDQLTGLCNRLQLDRTLDEERLRHQRYANNVCVMLLDIDRFKSVNDSFGHLVGDQVLIKIALILQKNMREVDVAGRWGGEEFLVICRETALEGALLLAEKLRAAVEAYEFELVGSRSISLGVAMLRQGDTVTQTIARADAALYRAKGAGRNRVESGELALP
ncbi:MAG: GGDEF domain-containing protein [Gammaproteobacteria bacterium]|uniref:GGDEF domain-containing protein n=1 Tax=Rhodoferax sp. TaxID=50421 RepID=UPI001D91E4AF|nr:GGDEF domain-containing protein [Rhodoferax sp.]MBU3898147.1 GGDEF domain-containing protein [Gammaproteobacteria bacterium]MBU4081659.1 GGDEF domain-containing protein [Gammaproteobacteria bacterium]